MNKTKKSQPKTPKIQQPRDFFQTPNYATDLIIPFLPKIKIWECASGNGMILKRLWHQEFDAFGTDIIGSVEGHRPVNFLEDDMDISFNAIVTNPPYSLKKEFYNKCLSYKVPFALLVPLDFCGWILRAMKTDKIQWLVPTRRIDFITPTGRLGKHSSSQYHSGWLTFGLNLPEQITIIELSIKDKENIG